jgi:hypothetical protein
VNRLSRAALRAATISGYAVRIARRPARLLPGLAGLGLISWGAAMIYLPAGLIVAGLSLLAIDRQIPPV